MKNLSLKAIIFIFVAVLVSYWQVAFGIKSLKWDMLDVILPFRYYAGECLKNGCLPLWNPYQLLGWPFYADLQCPTWYPETLFIGTLFGYSNLTLHFLLISYLTLAGFGFYKLIYFLTDNYKASLAGGIVYALCGFFVGHGQALFAIIGAVWLPYVILSYLVLFKNPKWTNTFIFAFFTWLMITGGYQTLTIISGYLLGSFFVFLSISLRKNIALLKKWLWQNLLGFLIIAGLCLPLIVSTIQVFPYVARFDKLPLELVQWLPFSPQSLISLVTPFATISKSDFFATDLSMCNAYMGIIILVFFTLYIFEKKNKSDWVFAGFGIICLAASFGKYIPVREWLYYYVPMMDKFKFPGYFILFFMLFFIIWGIKGFWLVISNSEERGRIKRLKKIIIFYAILVFGLFLLAFLKSNFSSFKYGKLFFPEKDNIAEPLLMARMAFQCAIQCCVLIILFLLIARKKINANLLILLIFFDMFLSVQFNQETVTDKTKPSEISHTIKNLVKRFPPPPCRNVSETTDSYSQMGILWRNNNIFRKQVSMSGFSSFQLNQLLFFEDSLSELSPTLNNPWVYTADSIFPESKYSTLKHQIKSGYIFVADSVYNNLIKYRLSISPDDKLDILSFGPNDFTIKITQKNATILNILQADFPGWKATLDNKDISVFRTNFLTKGVFIPAGSHIIKFHFTQPAFITSLVFSYALLFILFLIFIIYQRKKIKKWKWVIILFGGMIFFLVFPLLYLIKVHNKPPPSVEVNQVLSSINDFKRKDINWKTPENYIDTSFSAERGPVLRMDSTLEYGATFDYKNNTDGGLFDFVVHLNHFSAKKYKAKIIFSIANKDKSVHWECIDIKNEKENNAVWQEEKKVFRSPFYLKNGDIVSIYVWNNEKNNFYIDDFDVKVFKVKY